uniref:Uncharacterized protein n=1 Tax=Haptolina brevifila TaxID=156173 RepID=A0A7S2FS11_9EUKA
MAVKLSSASLSHPYPVLYALPVQIAATHLSYSLGFTQRLFQIYPPTLAHGHSPSFLRASPLLPPPQLEVEDKPRPRVLLVVLCEVMLTPSPKAHTLTPAVHLDHLPLPTTHWTSHTPRPRRTQPALLALPILQSPHLLHGPSHGKAVLRTRRDRHHLLRVRDKG